MRRAAALAMLALLGASPVAAELMLRVGEATEVRVEGATAAFAVEPAVVEARVESGHVVLVGRRAGRTVVTVVLRDAVETLEVEVAAPPARNARPGLELTRLPLGFWEARYDSGTRRLGTTLVASAMDDRGRSAHLRLYGMSESAGEGGETLRSLPSASLRLAAPGREVVLLDELVELSPLTVDGAVLRGLHLSRGDLVLHAGVASATPWDDLLLPEDGDRALALAWGRDIGRVRLTPALAWLPDARGDVRGVAALGLAHGAGTDAVQLRGEVGWGGAPGAALDLTFAGRRQRAWLQGLHRPAELAGLGIGRPPGSFLDGAWSAQLGGAFAADLAVSASALDLAGRRQEAGAARLELRWQASRSWSLAAGANGGAYRDRARPSADNERRGATLGAAWQGGRAGVSGLYRYQRNSAADNAGHGGRVGVRAAAGGFRGSLYVDAQQEAPTLDLVLRSRPGLERAMAELGLTAESPDEIVRLLRDNAPLFAEHGVQIGELQVDPLHLQGGVEVAWLGRGRARPELGLRVTADEARGVFATRRSTVATVSASRRLAGDTDVLLAYTRWSTAVDGAAEGERDSVELALRTRIEGMPSLPAGRRRSIAGSVGRDDRAHGRLDGELLPLGGVEVVLDGVRRTRTDSEGRYAFEGVGGGAHRVEVVLPVGAYFTTPSPLTIAAGGEARFAVTFAAARLRGRVLDDAGTALAGVAVRLEGPAAGVESTDSSGAFAFASPAGDARVSIVPESVPPGYELAALAPATVRLRVGAPAAQDLVVRAQRSVAGRVIGGRGPITVTAVELGRDVRTDGDGRFVLRGLPPGRLTLVVRGGGGDEARAVVELPAQPASLTGIELGPAGRP